MWTDLQETFYLTMGPFIVTMLLPLFIGGGLAVAIIMITARFWRPREKVIISHDDLERG